MQATDARLCEGVPRLFDGELEGLGARIGKFLTRSITAAGTEMPGTWASMNSSGRAPATSRIEGSSAVRLKRPTRAQSAQTASRWAGS